MSEICIRIAADLAASNRRVLVVSVEKILSMDPISCPGPHRFHTRIAQHLDMAISARPNSKSSAHNHPPEEIGLIPCGGSFDFILLDCSFLRVESGATQVAAPRTKPSSSSMRAKQKSNKSEVCSGRSNSPEPG